MSKKKGDMVRLIENPTAEVHKMRQRPPDIGRVARVKGEGPKPPPSCAPPSPIKLPPAPSVVETTAPSSNSPVTTVVISSTSGVHVKQPPNPNDKRTGRYLAVGAIITMVFITFYHTYLRSVPMLAGLVPPAIIMILYLLWIVYFAKKRKRQMQIELV